MPIAVGAASLFNFCDVDCNFGHFILLIQNFITFLIFYISIPLASIAFAYAGFLYMTAGGKPGQIERAHGIFWKVMWGFIWVMAGWLVVYTITNTLLDSGYSFLKP
ncbi:MAG: hypothetical protein Q7S15_02330 [bacterium]|nr:hypothetical protein [bacterium]